MPTTTQPRHQSGAYFLQFAMRVYALPGMKDTCLALQNQARLNVNCLLLAAWAAHLGYEIETALWADLQSHTAPIREAAVQPIRALRRQISRNEKLREDLRAPIKRLLLYAELRAEQAEERALHDRMRALAAPAPPGPALLLRNLAAYTGPSPELTRFATLVIESQLLEVPTCPSA
ncbi:MAG TPA: TIGR02444 family protein [Paludibaculum sp.]